MKHTEFFAKFYMGRSSCGILGHKSKEKIPEYFISAALPCEHYDVLPTSGSTYGKWFDGTRSPENTVWSTIAKYFDEDAFIDKVSEDLNDAVLRQIMRDFLITLREDETPDKRLFAFALAKQFLTIAKGCGEGDDVVKDLYKPDAYILSFPEYVEKTQNKYEKTETPFSDGEERMLEEVYVCNVLSSRLGTTRNRHSRTQERTITEATLEQIADYAKRVILVANCGMGKSMMLQHLFLESVKQHIQTGILPILIELRDFSENTDLFKDCIVKSASVFDSTLTEKKIEELMTSGKCQLLMDGADEIDPTDAKAFQTQIKDLTDRFPYNLYIIASRECDIIKGIKGFPKLYLMPFSKEQSLSLIGNLLQGEDDKEFKDEVIRYMESDFLQKHKVFASNPMLLTFVVMKYPIVDSFDGKKRLFYRKVYDTIVSGHDEEKQGYSRVFRSAQGDREFTKVFREFCAVTYLKHEAEFDLDTFEVYFEGLTTRTTLENPKIMTSKNFIHDACATACMMYEEEVKIIYIDPGFQEYLFAQYYFSAPPEAVEELSKSLWDVPQTEFDESDAFDMLYEFSSEKFDRYFLMPYLKNIFEGKAEDESFILFMRYAYKEMEYQVVDLDRIAEYSVENNAEWIPVKAPIIDPSSVVYSMLIKHLDIDGLLCFAGFQSELDYPEFVTAAIFGELYEDPTDGKKKILPRRLLRQEADDLQTYERTHMVDNFVRNQAGQLACLGHEYKVCFDQIREKPERYADLLEVLKTPDEDLWQAFCKIRAFYTELKQKYK
ncbi:MAG: NACHT domain-containing protein [Candidatus Avoscillospira sp.]